MRIDAVGEDLGGPRLRRVPPLEKKTLEGPASPGEAGPSGASPGETFPGTGPRKCIRYCKYGMPGGLRRGFLLGTDELLGFADNRVSVINRFF